MDTKYNLSITTSGENGDHASTNISTSDPGKLASILQLAGMSGGHPIPMDAQAAPAESHGTCDVCGGMHEGDDHVEEGENYDNEPNEFIHDPEEVTHTGNDLHKIKKTYPKVAGGDNPMALAETELRSKYENFLAETEQVEEKVELARPWKKTVQEELTAGQKKLPAGLQKSILAKQGETTESEDDEDNSDKRKEMNIKEVLELIDERGRDDAEIPTGGYGSGKKGLKVLTKAPSGTGRDDAEIPAGGYGSHEYDKDGNLLSEPLQVFGKAEVNTGGREGASGEIYGSKNDKPVGYGRSEGRDARLAAAAEAGFASLKQAREAGHPAGSEHTWTGSGAHAWPPKLSDEEYEREMAHMRQDAEGAEREEEESYLSQNLDSIMRDQDAGEVSQDTEIAKLRQNAGLLAKPRDNTVDGFDPRENPYDKSGKPGSKIDYSQDAIAARQLARQNASAAGGGREGSSDERHGSAEFDKQGKIIGGPFKGPFTKAPKQTGRENNQSGGSAEFDKQGKIIGKPFKGPFAKAPKPTEGGRD